MPEQDVARQLRQERQEEGGSGHAQHVAEFRARAHPDVFERIHKRTAPGLILDTMKRR
jgi:hypothetical protein